jgi:uncharacterized membrane protein YdjX (TVP38/TMEM64 family)
MTRRNTIRRLVVILAALLVPIIPFVIIGELPGDRWLSAVDDNALMFGLWGGGLLALDIVLPVPSSILGTLLGARLGFWFGFACTWVGLMAGNLIGFSLTRWALTRLRHWLPPFPHATTQAIVFLSRPVPVFAEAVALAAGATRMPVHQFLFLVGAGNAIYAAVLCANGAAFLPEAFVGPGLVLPMLLPVLAWLAWRLVANPGDMST